MSRLWMFVLLPLFCASVAFGQSDDLFDFETAIRQPAPAKPLAAREPPPVPQAKPQLGQPWLAQPQVAARPQAPTPRLAPLRSGRPQLAVAGDGPIEFRYARSNRPMQLALRPDQTLTPEVERFHSTGDNAYAGSAIARNRGGKLYQRYCAACHGREGGGDIGPDLTDDVWKYDRTANDVGQFEIIYGGGNNSMEAFGRWLDQDDILKIVAYLDVLQARSF